MKTYTLATLASVLLGFHSPFRKVYAMTRATTMFVLPIVVASLMSHALAGSSGRLSPNQTRKDGSSSSDIVPGVVVVKLRHSYSVPRGPAVQSQTPLLNAFAEHGVISLTRAFPPVTPLNDAEVAKGKIDLSQIHFAAIPPDLDPREVASRLAQLPQVEYAEPKYYSHLCDVPNDSDYVAKQQVYFDRMNVPAGWSLQKGSPSVVIATVDGGTNWEHPDLLPNIWFNPREDLNHDGIFERFPAPGGDLNGVDDDGNGYIDDVVGWNFANMTNNPRGFQPGQPRNADHGTATASVFGAATNNGRGMAGTCWNCRVMPVCAADPNSDDNIVWGFQGITYAFTNHARVINCSWGHTGNYSLMEQDVVTAATQAGALIVAAVDDHHQQTDFDNIPFYPASYQHVLSVGSTADTSDELEYFSEYGVNISVFAPGINIQVARDDGSYRTVQGTSFSSPLVAGLAGLLAAAHPGWTPDQIAEQIRMTADPIDASNPGYAGSLGHGRVNFGRALSEVHSGVTVSGHVHAISGRPFFLEGDTLILSVTLKNILFAPAQNLSFNVPVDSALLPLGEAHAPTSLGPGGEDSVDYTFRLGDPGQMRDVSIKLGWIANGDEWDARVFKTILYPQFAPSPWVVQRAPGLPQLDPEVGFSAVDADVCWGIKATNTFNSRQSPQIFRTTNGGHRWDSVTAPGRASGLEGSSMAALDANTAWAVMWDRSNATSGGVFKTTNAGVGWTSDTTLFPGSGGRPEGIHFFDPDNGVVFGDPRGNSWEIYTTADGGGHWTQVTAANIPAPTTADFGLSGHFESKGNTLWFGTFNRSVYKTTDRGMTWSAARNVLGADGAGVIVAFKDAMNGLACSPYNDVGANRIHKTTDGGATWTSLAPGSIPTTPSAIWITYNQGSHVYVITSVRGNDAPNHTIPGSAYSANDGSSWKQIDSLPHGPTTFTSSGVGWSDGANDVVYK